MLFAASCVPNIKTSEAMMLIIKKAIPLVDMNSILLSRVVRRMRCFLHRLILWHGIGRCNRKFAGSV